MSSISADVKQKYQPRGYRRLCRAGHLKEFTIRVQESDLHIQAAAMLSSEAMDALVECRGHLEAYIAANPDFIKALSPWPADPLAPPIVRQMIAAGQAADVGPMAAVAGAVAQYVGRHLKTWSSEVVVENGGDLYLDVDREVTIGIWAGNSPLSMQIGLKLGCPTGPKGICTSSGTFGHSRSLGNADAVCIVSHSGPLADAAATAVGNLVQTRDDLNTAIDFGRKIDGVEGILIIVGKYMGAWGSIDLTPLNVA